MNPTYEGPDPKKIENLFSSIANSYDKANDGITFGMARKWRKSIVKMHHKNIKAPNDKSLNLSVLDCATGTGDLAIDWAQSLSKDSKVVGIDFCESMLESAPTKAQEKDVPHIEFKKADMMALPFENEQFDAVSVAYGLRNVQDPHKALSEMLRVLKPNGFLYILETGVSGSSWFMKPFLTIYNNIIMTKVGGLISGEKSAYEYLNKSSKAFPSGKVFQNFFKEELSKTHFTHKTLMSGASHIYQIQK